MQGSDVGDVLRPVNEHAQKHIGESGLAMDDALDPWRQIAMPAGTDDGEFPLLRAVKALPDIGDRIRRHVHDVCRIITALGIGHGEDRRFPPQVEPSGRIQRVVIRRGKGRRVRCRKFRPVKIRVERRLPRRRIEHFLAHALIHAKQRIAVNRGLKRRRLHERRIRLRRLSMRSASLSQRSGGQRKKSDHSARHKSHVDYPQVRRWGEFKPCKLVKGGL